MSRGALCTGPVCHTWCCIILERIAGGSGAIVRRNGRPTKPLKIGTKRQKNGGNFILARDALARMPLNFGDAGQ